MIHDHIKVWNNVLEQVKGSLNVEDFMRWFIPLKPLRMEGSVLIVEAPNEFLVERLEENYIDILRKGIRSEIGEKGQLKYQYIKTNNVAKNSFQSPVRVSHPSRHTTSTPVSAYNPFVMPGLKKMDIDSNLNPNYTFENFIEGSCNRLARQAGIQIGKDPGKNFNPLILYGNVGLGKTHLIQAIGNSIAKNFPEKTVIYTSAEKFTHQFINSVKDNRTNEFSQFYNGLDALIIDDIQFLAGKSGTQEIFFHLFNHLHQKGKQIILTSDRAPHELKDIEDRLVNRFKWGLSTDLTAPDYETRMAIIIAKMEDRGIKIPEKIIDFICLNIKNNIRELEGIITSLIAQSTINQRKLDIELAQEVIKSYTSKANHELTPDEILEFVCTESHVSAALVKGKSRKGPVAQARHLSIYFIKKHLSHLTLKEIGEAFGGKDHSTILHSIKAVDIQMETDKIFRDKVEDFDKKLGKTLRIK
ncbi:MAG: chromosomal replication initiator protein DnaA [Saprospiraceae bacterium]|nr:chromosomal replication initiator protein DnaA [Saprospiraceae bacterium]MBK9992793.1 chromosomal replication initiator protein DnaA [Saprospiraceae bacterium]